MPNAVGGSYGIGMSSNISSYAGTELQKSISADKWSSGIKNDRSIANTRNALLKYARRLPTGDKMRVLSSQGISVYQGMSEDELNDAFIEMLIVNLPQKEVDALIQQSSEFDRKLTNDMSRVNSNLQRTIEMSKRAARAQTAQQKQNINITINSSKQKSTYVKEIEKGRTSNIQKQTKLTKYQIKGFNGLKKELRYILEKVYFKGDVYRLAIEMGIELQGGESIKAVTDTVIQRVIAYVSVLLGKTPKYIGNIMSNVKPFRELLQLTSYAYVTGTPGQSLAEIQAQQKAAMAAKQQAKVMNMTKKGNFITRHSARKAMGKKFAPFSKKLSGILENMSNYEIMDVASKLGIPTIGKNVDRYKLGKQIQDVMAERYTRQIKLQEKQKALKRVGKMSASVEAELQALKDTNPFKKDGNVDASTEIKPVLFNKAGQIINDNILKAMPVYVVGYGRAGQFKEEKEEKEDDTVSAGGKITGFFKNIWSKVSNPFTRGKRIRDQVSEDMAAPSEPEAADMSFIPGVNGTSGKNKPIKPVMKFEEFAQHYFPEIVESYISKGLTIDDMMSNANSEEMQYLTEEFKKYIAAAKKRKNGDSNVKAGTMTGFDFTDGVLTRLDTIIELMKGKTGADGGVDMSKWFKFKKFESSDLDSLVDAYKGVLPPKKSRRRRRRESNNSDETMIACYVDSAYVNEDEASIRSALSDNKTVFKTRKDGGVKKLLSKSFLEEIKSTYKINPTKAQNSKTLNAHGGNSAGTGLKEIVNELSDIADLLKSTDDFINYSLPLILSSFVLAAPMGVGMMTNPAALAMLGTNTAASAVVQGTKTMLNGLSGDAVAHAKGGSGRYVGSVPSGMTQFISGDSLDGGENKELVNIDWAHKTYHVKPIPKFATGGSGDSGTKVSGITSSERSAPMSVGITGPVAKYSFVPEGVSDMGEELAVKVINVTPGIYDIHPTYGMSAMDVLVAMSGSLGGIGTILNTELELQKVQTAAIQALGKSSTRSDGDTTSALGSGFTTTLDSILAGN